jgi:hypothetical protein
MMILQIYRKFIFFYVVKKLYLYYKERLKDVTIVLNDGFVILIYFQKIILLYQLIKQLIGILYLFNFIIMSQQRVI